MAARARLRGQVCSPGIIPLALLKTAIAGQREGGSRRKVTPFRHWPRRTFAVTLTIGVHPGGDFGDAFCRASLVPIAAWCSADAQRSYDLVAALDSDPTRKGNNIRKVEKRRACACR